jgi:hypothetical protein
MHIYGTSGQSVGCQTQTSENLVSLAAPAAREGVQFCNNLNYFCDLFDWSFLICVGLIKRALARAIAQFNKFCPIEL